MKKDKVSLKYTFLIDRYKNYRSKMIILRGFSKNFTRSILTITFFSYTQNMWLSEIYVMGTSAFFSQVLNEYNQGKIVLQFSFSQIFPTQDIYLCYFSISDFAKKRSMRFWRKLSAEPFSKQMDRSSVRKRRKVKNIGIVIYSGTPVK